MLRIKRSCSYKIITRAVQLGGRPLVALLMPGAEDCEPCLDKNQLQASLETYPDAIIVYNQQADAFELVKNLAVPGTQIYIEIRQDTRGVLGLHAKVMRDGEFQTLDLIYQ